MKFENILKVVTYITALLLVGGMVILSSCSEEEIEKQEVQEQVEEGVSSKKAAPNAPNCCTASCNGSECSAKGSSCSCYCNWLNNPVCNGEGGAAVFSEDFVDMQEGFIEDVLVNWDASFADEIEDELNNIIDLVLEGDFSFNSDDNPGLWGDYSTANDNLDDLKGELSDEHWNDVRDYYDN